MRKPGISKQSCFYYFYAECLKPSWHWRDVSHSGPIRQSFSTDQLF